MKDLNTKDSKFRFLMGGDFKVYCLQLIKSSEDFQNFSVFSAGMRVQCSFPLGGGVKIQGICIIGDDFLVNFPVGRGSFSFVSKLNQYSIFH